MYKIILVLFVIVAFSLIVLIMLQQNKDGSSGSIFSTRSVGNMLNSGSFRDGITQLIIILTILFFLFSLLLGNMNSKENQQYVNTHQNYQLKKK